MSSFRAESCCRFALVPPCASLNCWMWLVGLLPLRTLVSLALVGVVCPCWPRGCPLLLFFGTKFTRCVVWWMYSLVGGWGFVCPRCCIDRYPPALFVSLWVVSRCLRTTGRLSFCSGSSPDGLSELRCPTRPLRSACPMSGWFHHVSRSTPTGRRSTSSCRERAPGLLIRDPAPAMGQTNRVVKDGCVHTSINTGRACVYSRPPVNARRVWYFLVRRLAQMYFAVLCSGVKSNFSGGNKC